MKTFSCNICTVELAEAACAKAWCFRLVYDGRIKDAKDFAARSMRDEAME